MSEGPFSHDIMHLKKQSRAQTRVPIWPLGLQLPDLDIVHLHGCILSVVLGWVPGRVPLAPCVPEVTWCEFRGVAPGLAVGVVEFVREERRAAHSHVHDQEELKHITLINDEQLKLLGP